MRRAPSLIAAGLAAAAVLGGPAAALAAAGPIPVPTFTVTPSTNLFNGQSVDVAWSNLFVGITESAFSVWECLPGTFSTATCDFRANADAVSSGSVDVTVSRTVHSTTCETDTTQCSVRLVSNAGVEKGSADITFSSAK